MWSSFSNILAYLFGSYFPFYICAKVIYNKNLGLEKSEELILNMYKRQILSDKRKQFRAIQTKSTRSVFHRPCARWGTTEHSEPGPQGAASSVWASQPYRQVTALPRLCPLMPATPGSEEKTWHHSSQSLAAFGVWAVSKRGTMGSCPTFPFKMLFSHRAASGLWLLGDYAPI